MGCSRQEYWNGLSCPPPGDLPDPGNQTHISYSPALAGGFFTTSTTWEAPKGDQTLKRKRNQTGSFPRACMSLTASPKSYRREALFFSASELFSEESRRNNPHHEGSTWEGRVPNSGDFLLECQPQQGRDCVPRLSQCPEQCLHLFCVQQIVTEQINEWSPCSWYSE